MSVKSYRRWYRNVDICHRALKLFTQSGCISGASGKGLNRFTMDLGWTIGSVKRCAVSLNSCELHGLLVGKEAY